MICQEKCKAIVMLCNVVELGNNKCEQYWPLTQGEKITTASNITIKNLGSVESEKIFSVTSLELTAEAETFDIKHIQWTTWADYGVPTNIMAAFRLLSQVKYFPVVVIHCSAGIGRTGTIVGLELAQQKVFNGESLSIANIVKELRLYRAGSVQTELQYVYMHRVMLGLAENVKAVQREEIAAFLTEYESWLNTRKT